MHLPFADIRPPTRSDLPDLVGLLNAIDVAEIGRPDSSPEDLESDWEAAGFDLSRDAWLAVGPGGAPAGYAYTGDQLRTGELEGDVFVHPEGGEPGLARRMLDLVERRAAELAAERAYAGPRLTVFAYAGNAAKRRLLEEGGYEVRRRVLRMAIDLDPAAPRFDPPAGITVRAFRPDVDERAMYDVLQTAFSDDARWSREPRDAWRRRLVEHPDFDPGLWFLAWAGSSMRVDEATGVDVGEPVGGLVAYDHGDLGWVKGLGVLRSWRRRGVGSALLSQAFAALAARGQRRVELGVDADAATRPIDLYARAGMHVAHEYLMYQRRLG